MPQNAYIPFMWFRRGQLLLQLNAAFDTKIFKSHEKTMTIKLYKLCGGIVKKRKGQNYVATEGFAMQRGVMTLQYT